MHMLSLHNGHVSPQASDTATRLAAVVRPTECLLTHGITPALPRQLIPRRERFAWRARIHAIPPVRMAYRVCVAVAGVLLIVAAGLTGWLPGPGGIPLFLVGMAILASEFHWAHALTVRAMMLMRAFGRQTRRRKVLWIAGFVAVLLALGYLLLLVIGLPTWLPGWASTVLALLPGI
jgi:hypothetical protein